MRLFKKEIFLNDMAMLSNLIKMITFFMIFKKNFQDRVKTMEETPRSKIK